MRYFLLACLCVITSSCWFADQNVRGNGNIITEKMDFTGFHGLHVSGDINVQLKQDDNSSVSIRTDENLMEFIDVYMDGSTLRVAEKDGYNLKPTKDLVVYVAAPYYKEISVSGSGNITSENKLIGNLPLNVSVSGSGSINMDVDLSMISTNVSGSGTVNLSGETDRLEINLSGSGDIRCFELVSEDVKLDLSGSADAEVTANKTLDVNVSGSADVLYRGNANVTQRISGSGSVKKAG